jgi:hypothetical protein
VRGPHDLWHTNQSVTMIKKTLSSEAHNELSEILYMRVESLRLSAYELVPQAAWSLHIRKNSSESAVKRIELHQVRIGKD